MELRHLRAFAALSEHRHFGRAAQSLNTAQPALSQQIKQLERELGLPLFSRSTRRVEITEAGTRFAGHAERVLTGVDEAVRDMNRWSQGVVGRVAVGFVGTATYDVLPQLAREVRHQLPEVELDVRGELLSPDLVRGLVDSTYDLAVLRPDSARGVELALTPLRSEALLAALPGDHPHAHRATIDLAELAGDPFVTHPSGQRSSIHASVLNACAAAGFSPRVVLEAAETATLMVFVAAGLGVALVPSSVRSLGISGVSYVGLDDPPRVELALAQRPGPLTPSAGRVAGILRATAQDPRP